MPNTQLHVARCEERVTRTETASRVAHICEEIAVRLEEIERLSQQLQGVTTRAEVCCLLSSIEGVALRAHAASEQYTREAVDEADEVDAIARDGVCDEDVENAVTAAKAALRAQSSAMEAGDAARHCWMIANGVEIA